MFTNWGDVKGDLLFVVLFCDKGDMCLLGDSEEFVTGYCLEL